MAVKTARTIELKLKQKRMKMKTNPQVHSTRAAFTLIEIVGVVAVIAILAAVLTPRVVSVIARGKVNATAQSLGSLKSATADYIGKNGTLPARAGTGATNAAVATGRFDADLVAGGFTEKLFAVSIGTQTFDASALGGRVHVRSQAADSAGAVSTPDATTGGVNFDLDRSTASADFTTGQMVVSAFIPGVSITDAIALNKILDGDENTGTSADITGRCIYSAAAVDNTVTVYVYVAHY
jgi:type II secretory pathway pseudopilin PulG